MVNFKNWLKSLESMVQYIWWHSGVEGGPLSHVTHCDLFLSAAVMDLVQLKSNVDGKPI